MKHFKGSVEKLCSVEQVGRGLRGAGAMVLPGQCVGEGLNCRDGGSGGGAGFVERWRGLGERWDLVGKEGGLVEKRS